MELRRRLYARGSSHETTIPKPLLFALDQRKKHDVVFSYDAERGEWRIRFAERSETRQRPEPEGKGGSAE